MFLPSVIGALLPIVNEVSPTSIGAWAMASRPALRPRRSPSWASLMFL